MTELRIVNFHGIGDPERELEAGEAPYFVSLDRFCDVLDRIVAHPDRERLAITFDDSNSSDRSLALSQLLRRKLTASFFILTGRIGKPGSLDVEDIRALVKAGMRVGSHGVDHRDWRSISASDLERELISSKSRLEDICGKPIRTAAIPFGRYNSRVLRAIRRAGYEAAYSSDRGSGSADAFLRPRWSIRNDATPAMIEQHLSGRLSPARRLRRNCAMAVKYWI